MSIPTPLIRTLLQSARSARPSSSRALLPRSIRLASSIPTPPTPLPQSQPTSADPHALQQSPNVPTTWSTSQMPKKEVFTGNARFEQTAVDLQPNAPSAMGMVAEDPVRMVNGRKAACDGGGGALGHPKIYINLDKPGPKACGYCGIRFEQAHEHH